ncbi:hypothetical protein PNA2_1716 [Pyrococcus sp. NA2]|nr:hypothetical protein PNA2_1716 [Pyrococcus sp. NA2]
MKFELISFSVMLISKLMRKDAEELAKILYKLYINDRVLAKIRLKKIESKVKSKIMIYEKREKLGLSRFTNSKG